MAEKKRHPEIKVSGPRWSVIIPVTVVGCVTVIVLALMFRWQFGLILLTGTVLVAAGGGGKILYSAVDGGITLFERWQNARIVKYNADGARLNSGIITVSKTQRIVTRPDAPVRVIEAVIEPAQAGLLPEAKEKLDFLTVFTQPEQAYAVIAGQRVGKTTLAQEIVRYWLSCQNAERPTVIAPVWCNDEWTDCQMYGGNDDYDAVYVGLELLLDKARECHRQAPPFSIKPVFIDDWTNIVKNIRDVEKFMTSATTMFAKAGFVMYFLIHSDTTGAWGVDKVGAALKDNFVKLLIEPHRDRRTGQIQRHLNKGFIVFPGEKERRAVELPRFGALSGEIVPEAERIEELILQGKSNYAISQEVWGSRNGERYNRIDVIRAGMS